MRVKDWFMGDFVFCLVWFMLVNGKWDILMGYVGTTSCSA